MSLSKDCSLKRKSYRSIFEVDQDLSSAFSKLDLRHDNNYANIFDIKILSIIEEIQFSRLKYLSSSNSTKHYLSNLASLFDRQFKLLRKDIVNQLYDAI